MTFPYRCNRASCRQRVTLRRIKERYVRDKLCPTCGHDSLRLDRWKQRDHKKSRCLCDGYWFPHRRGSKWCTHYQGELTDEDLQERYRGGRAMRKTTTIIAVCAAAGCMMIAGTMSHEDAVRQQALYCDKVGSGELPDYDGTYASACPRPTANENNQ